MPAVQFSALLASGANLYAGTYSDGAFRSTDNGANWNSASTGLTSSRVFSLAMRGINLFAGTVSRGVFLSTNAGESWSPVNTGIEFAGVNALFLSGTSLYAGTEIGVFLSTDNGTSWSPMSDGLTNTFVSAFALSGTNLFAGTYGTGVYLSTNNGTSWSQASAGLTDTYVRCLAVSGTDLFAGILFGGVWRRPLSEMVCVKVASSELPTEFSVDQNYPNPFNPNSDIRYQISEFRHVTLAVYDLLGREVAILVNERKTAGSYGISFNAGELASGAYFARLTAGTYVATRRMLLIK